MTWLRFLTSPKLSLNPRAGPRMTPSPTNLSPCLEALLQNGATANVRDSFDRTPAHLACMSNAQIPNSNGHVYSLMNLVEKGRVSVNAKDRFGQTALHLACIGGNVFTAKWLVDKGGADPMVPDGLGKTPGQYLPGGPNQLLGIDDNPPSRSPSPQRGWGSTAGREVIEGGWRNKHLGYASPGGSPEYYTSPQAQSPIGLSNRLDTVLGKEKQADLLDPGQVDGDSCKQQ